MRDSVPSARYSPICNVLRQWKTSLNPIYRVYRLYDTVGTCPAPMQSVRTATPITGTLKAFTVTYIACNDCDQREEMADKGRRKRAVEYGDNPCTLEKSDARVSVTSCISSCTSTYGGNGKSHRGSNFARCS